MAQNQKQPATGSRFARAITGHPPSRTRKQAGKKEVITTLREDLKSVVPRQLPPRMTVRELFEHVALLVYIAILGPHVNTGKSWHGYRPKTIHRNDGSINNFKKELSLSFIVFAYKESLFNSVDPANRSKWAPQWPEIVRALLDCCEGRYTPPGGRVPAGVKIILTLWKGIDKILDEIEHVKDMRLVYQALRNLAAVTDEQLQEFVDVPVGLRRLFFPARRQLNHVELDLKKLVLVTELLAADSLKNTASKRTASGAGLVPDDEAAERKIRTKRAREDSSSAPPSPPPARSPGDLSPALLDSDTFLKSHVAGGDTAGSAVGEPVRPQTDILLTFLDEKNLSIEDRKSATSVLHASLHDEDAEKLQRDEYSKPFEDLSSASPMTAPLSPAPEENLGIEDRKSATYVLHASLHDKDAEDPQRDECSKPSEDLSSATPLTAPPVPNPGHSPGFDTPDSFADHSGISSDQVTSEFDSFSFDRVI